MTEHSTLDWGSLSPDELEQIQKACDLLEANCGSDDPSFDDTILDDARLSPFVRERMRELSGIAMFFGTEEATTGVSSPDQIGPFQITGTIAEGTITDVYLGEQEDPSRQVAIKLLHSAGRSPKIERSFKREVGILAKLDHPGIGKVYYAGTSDHGGRSQPYFAMEFIDGIKLTEFVRQSCLSLHETVALFVKVCKGVGHAHQAGVIHRDLKPANILVNQNGEPKILDFGIATWAEASATRHSRYGVGTPGYMSPEQFSIDARQDTRSDIYSLGVILYQLICGELPYEIPIDSMVKAAKAVSTGQHVPLRSRARNCPRDLSAIVHHCLEQKPEDRYQSVQSLSDDLTSFLDGRPVIARPLVIIERTRRLIARHRTLAAIGFLSIGCVMAGTVTSILFWRHAERTADSLKLTVDQLKESQENIERTRDELTGELRLRRRSALNHVLVNADRNWQASPDLVGQWLDEASRSNLAPDSFAMKVQRHRTSRVIRELQSARFRVVDLAYSPDGHSLVTVADNGYVTGWNLSTGELIWQRSFGLQQVPSCDYHPEGRQVLVIDEGQLLLLDAENGKTLHRDLSPSHRAKEASFSPIGDRIVSWNDRGDIYVWDSKLDGRVQEFSSLQKGFVTIDFVEDSTALIAILRSGSVMRADIGTGELRFLRKIPPPRVYVAAVSGDGSRFAVAHMHGNLRILKTDELDPPVRAMAQAERFDALAFSHDGDWLLSANRRRIEARRSDLSWKKTWSRLIGTPVTALKFSPTGQQYAIGLNDGRIQHCMTQAPRIDHVVQRGLQRPRAFCFPPDMGSVFVVGDAVEEFDLSSGLPIRTFDPIGAAAPDLACTASGMLFVAGGKARWMLSVDPGSTILEKEMEFERSVRAVDVYGSSRLVIGLADGDVYLVNHPDGEIVRELSAHQDNVTTIAIHQASGRFASGSEGGEIAIWSRDGELISRRQEHTGAVASLVFTKLGDRLISASDDRTVAVYNVVSSQRELLIRHSREKCRAVAISPDGETIALGGADREITLCDSKTGELQATLQGHRDTISDLQFAPDGNALFSLSLDGTLRRWAPSDF